MVSNQSETSSRVRQFGLYKTIDARTEEFLRLSRKRQMRQGCACAAISTAVTVTIIIAVLLVYELNVIPKTQLKLIQNWKKLRNDTTEALSLNNAKPVITLKITTQQQSQEKIHSTEFSIKKNAFSDPNKWFRLPTSKVYAIGYKTSPVVYIKTPKSDYFTKIRKIRDYQRIINYVDKMISSRVTSGTTKPIQREDEYVDDEVQTPRELALHGKTDPPTTTIVPKIKTQDIKNCKCPKKINDILSKLLANIKLLLPQYNKTKSVLENTPCDINNAKLDSIEENVISSPFNVFTVEENAIKKKKHNSNTVVSLLQHKLLAQKTLYFKSHLKNNAPQTTPSVNIENTEMNEENGITGKQLFNKNDPLHFIAISPYNTDKKLKKINRIYISEKPSFSSTVRIHYAKYNPLHFLPITPFYVEREGNKYDDERTLPFKDTPIISIKKEYNKYPPLHFLATTINYRESNSVNNGEKSSTSRDDTLQKTTIKPDCSRDKSCHKQKPQPIKGFYERVEDKLPVTRSTTDKYLNYGTHKLDVLKKKKVVPCKDINKLKSTKVYKPNNKKSNDLRTPKIKWYNRNRTKYRKTIHPNLTTHYFYHRHNSTLKSYQKSKFRKATTKLPLHKISTLTPTFATEKKSKSNNSERKLNETRLDEKKYSDFDENLRDNFAFRWDELNLDDDIEKIINEDSYQELELNDEYTSTALDDSENHSEESVAKNPRNVRIKDDDLYMPAALLLKLYSNLENMSNTLQEDDDNDDVYLKRLLQQY